MMDSSRIFRAVVTVLTLVACLWILRHFEPLRTRTSTVIGSATATALPPSLPSAAE